MASNRLDTFAWIGLLLVLILAPLPAASISPPAQASLAFALFLLLAISAGFSPSRTRWSSTAESRFRIIMACWMLAVAFSICQVIPLPPKLIAFLAPSLSDLYAQTLPAPKLDAWRSVSTSPGATVQAGLLVGAYAAAMLLIVRVCRTRGRMLALAGTIIAAGAVQAIIALGHSRVSLSIPASGTFVNRNHYAAYLVMALGVSLGLVLFRWHEELKDRPADDRFGMWWKFERWVHMSPLLMVALLLIAGVIFSFSRTGLILSLAIVAVFSILGALGSYLRFIGLVLACSAAAGYLLASGAWRGLRVVARRFEMVDPSERFAAWKSSYALFETSPLTGVGLGSLVENLSRYVPESIKDMFDHAHNEPLELLAEGGIVYASVFAVGLLVYLSTVFSAWWTRRDAFARGVGWGCLVAALAVFCFSQVEFPLRMPANGLTLVAILALGWLAVHSRSAADPSMARGPSIARSFSSRLMPGLAILGLAVSALLLAGSLLDQGGDTLLAQVETRKGEPRRALIQKATQMYGLAQQIEPWQPSHPFKLGHAFEWLASALPPISDETMAAWRKAETAYEQAVALHPVNARVQAAWAWAALQSGHVTESRRAVHAAMDLAPGDPHVRFAASKWYLVQWEGLDTGERNAAGSWIRRGVSDLPVEYVEALWRFVPDLNTIKTLVPDDLRTRRVWLGTLTDRQLFSERWAEQDAQPALHVHPVDEDVVILSSGRLHRGRPLPIDPRPAGKWTGMVEGWLSSGLTAATRLELPPGEVVLFIPMRAEMAGGVWPMVNLTLDGHSMPLLSISDQGWRTTYLHLYTQGGIYRLQAIVTNGAVIQEDGRFAERRVALGPVQALLPHNTRRFDVKYNGNGSSNNRELSAKVPLQ